MIHIFVSDKEILKELRRESPPSESVRARVRQEKPKVCLKCKGEVLHENGWCCRSLVKSWSDWECIWYWRVECQSCGKSHCLMPDSVIPDLQYGIDVVSDVVVVRYNGKCAKEFEPHRRTQKRWLDRIRSWWPIALSSGVVRGALSEWAGCVSSVLDAIRRCAVSHIGLFFPSLSERSTSGRK
jgi:hypothetical protein